MRLRAVDAGESGVQPEDVAAWLGMGRGTVYGWLAKHRAGGWDALKARPVPGRQPKLSGEQMRRLYTLIAGADPRQLEFGFALWTRDMVRTLIRREFKVSLSAVSVGRLLRTLGLSPQRPLWRAWQADPDAVARWKEEEFPAIRAQAKAEGATIYFGDEAGIRSDYHAGTTWAPVGQTPVVKATGARHSLNMISAVTAKGLLRFSTYTGSFTGARFIEFCRKLMADTDGPVYLVVDGHPTHRSKLVKEFVASTTASCGCSCCPPTPRSSTPTSGSGRTSSTTGSGAPVSPARTTSRPRSSARSGACRRCPTSSAPSSPTPTCATSQHDQSPLTNEPFSIWQTATARPLGVKLL